MNDWRDEQWEVQGSKLAKHPTVQVNSPSFSLIASTMTHPTTSRLANGNPRFMLKVEVTSGMYCVLLPFVLQVGGVKPLSGQHVTCLHLVKTQLLYISNTS